jgi:hypothetical protein
MKPLSCQVLTAAALLLLSALVQAEEYSVTCPLSIEANAVRVIRTPANWTSGIQGPFWLHSAGPMDGPPSDMAVLKESVSTERVRGKVVTTWDLRGVFASGKWMACNYGYANDFILSQKLDDNTSQCIVSSVARTSGKVDIDIRCQR